jgi:hypothetical protein
MTGEFHGSAMLLIGGIGIGIVLFATAASSRLADGALVLVVAGLRAITGQRIDVAVDELDRPPLGRIERGGDVCAVCGRIE